MLLAALAVFPLLFAQSMGRSLSHDEHQHVAAGVLIAREGLLPYRDFPYLHTPYLPLVYSLFLGHCENLLLATRLFSTVCGALIAGVLFLAAFRGFAALRMAWRLCLAAAFPLLLLATPVFVFTIGRTSNQELSILLALLATLSFVAASRTPRCGWLFLPGLLLALAIGTRVTFAPLFAPFAGALYFFSRAEARRIFWSRFAIFCAGVAVGSLPMLWLFLEAPARFIFGVLQFSQANIEYRQASGNPQNMELWSKLRFMFKEVVGPNFAACAAALVPLAIFAWQRRRARFSVPIELGFLLSLLPFLLLGAMAPSPMFEQYFCAFVPFLLLIGIFCGRRLELTARIVKPSVAAALSALVGSAFMAVLIYRNLDELLTPGEWTPVKRHEEALILRKYTSGAILTLAPIHVLEAGLQIVPEFVTGPFAWRVAEFLPLRQRRDLGLVGAGDLETFFAKGPPAAILVGHEQRWEPALIAYAERHGYRRVAISDEEEAIWLSPKNVTPAK